MEDVQTRQGLYGFEFRESDQRRVDPSERKRYEIKQLWQRSHEIINLASQGWKGTDIAEILGITPACVSMTLNSELGQKKLADVRLGRDEEAKKNLEKIRILTAKALQVYHEIFDDESGESSLKDKKAVADTVVLELSGLKVPTKVQNTSVSTMLSAEELQAFKERGMKAAREAGAVIDVEPEQPNAECSSNPNPVPNPDHSRNPSSASTSSTNGT